MIAHAALYFPCPEDAVGAATPVAGRPVAFRAIASAVRAGARRVLVPASLRRPPLEAAIRRSPRVREAVTWIARPADVPDGPLLLVPASAVVSAAAVRRVLDTGAGAVLAESHRAGAPVAAFGKAVARAFAPALAAGADTADALDRELKSRETIVVPGNGSFVRVTSHHVAVEAEALLYADLGSAIDTRLDVLVHRRLSRHLSRLAVRLGVGPNAITVASLVVGAAAAWCVALATPLAALAGLLVYLAAVVLDHADGEVARLTLTESAVGEWLDVAADTVVHALLVLAMGVAAREAAGSGLALGIVGAAGVVASAALAKWKPPASQADAVGSALDRLTSRDGFYAMLIAFVIGLSAAPALLPALMIVIAAGAHAYWVARLLYLLVSRR